MTRVRTPEQKAIRRIGIKCWQELQKFRREEGLAPMPDLKRQPPSKPVVTHIAGYVPAKGSIAWSLLGRIVPSNAMGAPS